MDGKLRSNQDQTKAMEWDSKKNKGNDRHVAQMTQPGLSQNGYGYIYIYIYIYTYIHINDT